MRTFSRKEAELVEDDEEEAYIGTQTKRCPIIQILQFQMIAEADRGSQHRRLHECQEQCGGELQEHGKHKLQDLARSPVRLVPGLVPIWLISRLSPV